MKSESEVAQSCPSLRDPMDCSLPGSSVHGIFSRLEYWSGVPSPSQCGHSRTLKNNPSHIPRSRPLRERREAPVCRCSDSRRPREECQLPGWGWGWGMPEACWEGRLTPRGGLGADSRGQKTPAGSGACGNRGPGPGFRATGPCVVGTRAGSSG